MCRGPRPGPGPPRHRHRGAAPRRGRPPPRGWPGGTARAVPSFGDDREQPGRDHRSALPAAAETPGGQPAQGLFDVRQFPAGLNRAAKKHPQLLRAWLAVTAAVRGQRFGTVISQGQFGDFLQPCPPPGLQKRPPVRATRSGGQRPGPRGRRPVCLLGHHASRVPGPLIASWPADPGADRVNGCRGPLSRGPVMRRRSHAGLVRVPARRDRDNYGPGRTARAQLHRSRPGLRKTGEPAPAGAGRGARGAAGRRWPAPRRRR